MPKLVTDFVALGFAPVPVDHVGKPTKQCVVVCWLTLGTAHLLTKDGCSMSMSTAAITIQDHPHESLFFVKLQAGVAVGQIGAIVGVIRGQSLDLVAEFSVQRLPRCSKAALTVHCLAMQCCHRRCRHFLV